MAAVAKQGKVDHYEAQKVLLQKVDAEEIPMKELLKRGRDMLDLIVAGKDPMQPPAEEGEAVPEKEELSPA